MKDLVSFKKEKDYIVCADSDGCVIDGMTIKHKECFGPCLVDEWELEKYREDVLKKWNQVNLYSTTRGINRFKGLLTVLDYVNQNKYIEVDTVDLKTWIDSTDALSNSSLTEHIKKSNSQMLKKVLQWSETTNKCINALSEDKKMKFSGVTECFKEITNYAQLAVISAANKKAVVEEWEHNDLMEYVNIIMSQECGSKKECIRKLIDLGFEKDKIIMLGDSPGDIESAIDNDVLYYPIMVDYEVESWNDFKEKVFPMLLTGEYKEGLMASYKEEYNKNLLKSR